MDENIEICPSCGGENLDRWQDNYGEGWQCHDMTCQWFSIDGELE